MDYILYHANCQDGWVAAFIAKRRYPEAELIHLSYGLSKNFIDELFQRVFEKDVLMVDYSFPIKDLNEQLANVTKSLLILDHHKTKEENLRGTSYGVFDNSRSGAGLAWDYLFGKDSTISDGVGGQMKPFVYQTRPWWVNYTEDQDLWKWLLPHSREINAFLMVQPRTIGDWEKIAAKDAAFATACGEMILKRVDFEVDQAIRTRQSGEWEFEGRKYSVAVVNGSAVVSEAGDYLVNGMQYDIALFWHEGHDGIVHFGLRSKEPSKGGTVDVGAIAKAQGGGGHFSSSGFEISVLDGRILVDEILQRYAFPKVTVKIIGGGGGGGKSNGPFNRCS